MTKDNRRILTWSLNAGSQAYEEDIAKYNKKIYSIGMHEFGVNADGKIYDFRSLQNYFDSAGNHTGIRVRSANENHMVAYPSIKWYVQMIVFGWGKVKPFLDNNVLNSEGRFPQDQFILELGKVVDLYEYHVTTGERMKLTGVEMDVEATMTEDPYSQGYDELYIELLERIKNEVLIPREMKLRVNSFAMWGNRLPYYYRFHNYKLFAETADMNGNATIDEIQLMTYDFAWNGSSAGASTPTWWFKNVGDWCRKCFDPALNPDAKLTMDNLFFGAAGYGHRWGMNNQDVVKAGSTITYRNLLGWQNGLYRHYEVDSSSGENVYVYKNQDYLYQASIQDGESKNEVMYPHVYDMFKPNHVDILTQHGGEKTATVGEYNRLDYATTNFKTQIPKFTNIVTHVQIPTRTSGKAFPVAIAPVVQAEAESQGVSVSELDYATRRQYDPNFDPDSVDFQHIVRTIGTEEIPFMGWKTEKRIYQEKYVYDGSGNIISALCEMEDEPDGLIEYDVHIPTAGNYKVIAITSFSWYTQAKLGGFINGTQFVLGGDAIPEWYPFFMKGVHFYDLGAHTFNAGTNTVSFRGELSDANTPIYGIIVCEDFDANFSGGEMTAKANIQPMKNKDGLDAATPTNLALAMKMLRRDARPAILWDDEFRTYEEETMISGSTYYRQIETAYKYEGGGTTAINVGTNSETGQPVFKCYSEPANIGHSHGDWIQRDYGLQNVWNVGQLVLAKKWTVNIAVEATIEIFNGDKTGLRLYAQADGIFGDGYLFVIDFNIGKIMLILENNDLTSEVIAEQPLGSQREGDTIVFRALLHNGVGQFFIDGVQAFIEGSGNPVTCTNAVDKVTGEVILERTSGACGVYVDYAYIKCSHFGIGTTDRWETMEKFEVTVDGITESYGEIARTGYAYDEFGYLIYSGLDEVGTRDSVQFFDEDVYAVSLDYEFNVMERAAWLGAKDVKIKLRDAGVWFGELLVGDREGMSIIWAGDAWSFLDAMNMAVNDYGAKGIGLWTMGQEDPYLFELVPNVV